VIITCSSCGKRYNLDPARLAGRREASVRCTSCQSVIRIALPATEEAAAEPATGGFPAGGGPPAAPAPAPASPAGAPPVVAAAGDQTARLPADAGLLAAPGHVDAGPLEMPAGRRVSLAVLDGPELGKIYRIERPSVVLGRGGADVHLEDAEVSRHHARLEMRGGRAVIRDLGSTNGTFVNDVKVAEAEIEDRGEFRIGQTRLMLILAEEPPTA
jgi:predicted Zn finger-like uncharacterized protein